MPTPVLIKYPYDPSGEASTNLVVGEPHAIPRSASRAFALYHGPFFANSVKILHPATGDILVKGTDYETLYLYELATKKVGQPVTAVIYVTNPAYHGQLLVDYQVVGGEFSTNMSAIQQLIQSLQIDNRAIVWNDILYKPVRFPAAPHLHHVGDFYGMEAVVSAINNIADLMENGQLNLFNQMTTRWNEAMFEINVLQNTVGDLNNQISELSDRISLLGG